MIQVLIDADNVSAPRVQALLRAVPTGEAEVVVAGSPQALNGVDWPPGARVMQVEGWQQADLVLVDAYRSGTDPLVLVSGDGDFGLLAGAHAGPVLVISDRPASRLRTAGTVIDPVLDGVDAVRHWFDAVLDSAMDPGEGAGPPDVG